MAGVTNYENFPCYPLRHRDERVGFAVKRLIPALNVVGILIFALFAWLQREDDNAAVYADASKLDALLWIGFYALIALLFALALFRRFPWPLYLLTAGFCLYQMVVTGPGLWENLFGAKEATILKDSMNPDDPRVELSREFFGALIALVAAGLLWLQRRKPVRSDRVEDSNA